ncbi:hypothetical protein THAOC_15734 [Thalassiosira oceanica]|uniref:Uncharacterized protein n=1 Tax=Thalassiosira oceanica TaxID=159749 RepID=K0SRF2_THAOC|nr:hypothetical protein THAOC_15734 [Thalassiosira oceanica]|eukprot:EJK63596.1 hypothetical protein THAOC_15734 [Thalassiosira oceanica]
MQESPLACEAANNGDEDEDGNKLEGNSNLSNKVFVSEPSGVCGARKLVKTHGTFNWRKDEVHGMLEEISNKNKVDITGTLMLNVYPWRKCEDKRNVFNQDTIEVNVFEEIEKRAAIKGPASLESTITFDRLYLSNERLPDDWLEKFDDSPLYKNILQKSIEGRSPLISNGGGQNRRLVCKYFHRPERKSVKKDRKLDEDVEYRSVSLVNNKKQSRSEGRAKPRKTKRPDTEEGTCKLGLTSKSFFVL